MSDFKKILMGLGLGLMCVLMVAGTKFSALNEVSELDDTAMFMVNTGAVPKTARIGRSNLVNQLLPKAQGFFLSPAGVTNVATQQANRVGADTTNQVNAVSNELKQAITEAAGGGITSWDATNIATAAALEAARQATNDLASYGLVQHAGNADYLWIEPGITGGWPAVTTGSALYQSYGHATNLWLDDDGMRSTGPSNFLQAATIPILSAGSITGQAATLTSVTLTEPASVFVWRHRVSMRSDDTNCWALYNGALPLIEVNGQGVTVSGLTNTGPASLGEGALLANVDEATVAVPLTLSSSLTLGGQTRTNWPTGGDVYAESNNVMTGSSNYIANLTSDNFSADTVETPNLEISGSVRLTNASGVIWLGRTNYHGGDAETNAVLALSDRLQVRNPAGAGTNVAYVDPATGALLWNSDRVQNIGAVASNRPKNIYSETLTTSGQIKAGGNVEVGDNNYLAFSGGCGMVSVDDGTLRVTGAWPYGVTKSIISGPPITLTDNAATRILRVSGGTNSFVGGEIAWSIFCLTAGGERQALSGATQYAAVNTNGVWAAMTATNTVAQNAFAATSGTLGVTWTMASTDSTTVQVNVTADTSLTPSQFYLQWQCRNNGTNAVVQ